MSVVGGKKAGGVIGGEQAQGRDGAEKGAMGEILRGNKQHLKARQAIPREEISQWEFIWGGLNGLNAPPLVSRSDRLGVEVACLAVVW